MPYSDHSSAFEWPIKQSNIFVRSRNRLTKKDFHFDRRIKKQFYYAVKICVRVEHVVCFP